jgi:hypothetical protein
VTDPDFARLFAMGAFEALRVLRLKRQDSSGLDDTEIVRHLRELDAGTAALDLDAGVELDAVVRSTATVSVSHSFYRHCIFDIINAVDAPWARAIKLGRARLLTQLSRDEHQCFREARLLDDPPDDDLVSWWDDLSSAVRATGNADAMERARRAERLSIEVERKRLATLGIPLEPRWIAIEDNTAGYDVLSFDLGDHGPLNRLVEVKSTIASPLRFYVTRNEWNKAIDAQAQYCFHVWDLSKTPPTLYEIAQAAVAAHVPTDCGAGTWDSAVIPVNVARGVSSATSATAE